MIELVVVITLLGLLIGSFLNVVIYRVPRGESVVSPRSRCPGCGTELAWYDNVPVLSWIVLRGRCRTCAAPISWRYPAVELLTGLLFGAVAWWNGATWSLPAYLYLAAIGVALSAIDIDTKRLPNAIVLPSYVVTAVVLLIPTILEGWRTALVFAAITGIGLFIFYFLLAFIYPAGMGLGDVKLAGVLGLYLGWSGSPGFGLAIVATFVAFVLGSIVGVGVMVRTGNGRKTKVPFGPFMIVGTFFALFAGHGLVDWYTSALGI